jgi:hypothetical protein
MSRETVFTEQNQKKKIQHIKSNSSINEHVLSYPN